MDLAIISDGSAAELDDLREWLHHEPEFRAEITVVENRPRSGELGPITDALSIAVGSGGALTALATSLRAYFAQPKRADLRVTIRSGDGRSFVLDAKRVEHVEALLRTVVDQVD
jgi:hypothetical protein